MGAGALNDRGERCGTADMEEQLTEEAPGAEHRSPGWYPDPAGSGHSRWWSGTQWAMTAMPQAEPASARSENGTAGRTPTPRRTALVDTPEARRALSDGRFRLQTDRTDGRTPRPGRNLFIFSTVVLSTVCLVVLVTWSFSLMKLHARRLVLQRPEARDGAVFIGWVRPEFLSSLTPYSTTGGPVSVFLAHPVLVISPRAISIWKGVLKPLPVAFIPHGALGQTRWVERRRFGVRGSRLETVLLEDDATQPLVWSVRALGPLGLQPAGRRRHQEAVLALERLLPPD